MLTITIALTSLFTLAQLPAPIDGGYFLPNGWTITPIGKHVPAQDTVLNMARSPDGKFIAVLSGGFNKHELMLIDTETQEPVQHVALSVAWLGLAWAPDGKTLYVSGGNRKNEGAKAAGIYAIPFDGKQLKKHGFPEWHDALPREQTFWTGLAVHPSLPRLYAANRLTGEVVVFDTESGAVTGRIQVERDPYDLVISADGAFLYCSNWGSDSLSVIDLAQGKTVRTVAAGDNPNDMLLLPDGRLFVCSSNDNSVRCFDTQQQRFTERILTSMHPQAPEGSTPNALAFDPETEDLYVANADNYNVCVINVEDPGECVVLGFIPAGWYPSALALAPDGRHLYIGNAKGIASAPTPKGPKRPPGNDDLRNDNIKKLMSGDVSIVDLGAGSLAAWTDQCVKNSPYNDTLLAAAKAPAMPSVVPHEVGAGSPIKHILYIIKENRTYDQVYGDLPRGNGDPSLCLFGRDVTPNQHALAEQFVLLDNLYCDAEVSVDGHMWSNAAYATDFIEKNWPASYGGKTITGDSPAMLPAGGFLWDRAAQKGLSYRNYGEFAARQSDGSSMAPKSELLGTLHGHVAPNYLSWGARDTENAKEFLREFDAFEAHFDDTDPALRLPNLMVLALPEDHTVGTKPGKPTPRAAVASNDLALGQIVDRITHSRYWPETAIFVIQDDAQDGSDHVDARRTIGQAISPYTRRGTVDSTLYTTSGMLRTIELLLGLEPMSQFDAAATPMYAALGDVPDLTPFTHLPAAIDINELNAEKNPGAQASLQMDFSDLDRAPMFALNEIVWKSVKGEDSAMPLPVHQFHPGDPMLAMAD